MGVSTDGILCYGFSLGDEGGVLPSWLLDGDPEDEDSNAIEFVDFLAKLYELPHPGEWSGDEATLARFHEYWDKQRQLEKDVGIEVVNHCSGEYPMFILAVAESVKTAARGSITELGQNTTANPEWEDKLRAFCEKAGIKFEEPQFLLCSMWL